MSYRPLWRRNGSPVASATGLSLPPSRQKCRSLEPLAITPRPHDYLPKSTIVGSTARPAIHGSCSPTLIRHGASARDARDTLKFTDSNGPRPTRVLTAKSASWITAPFIDSCLRIPRRVSPAETGASASASRLPQSFRTHVPRRRLVMPMSLAVTPVPVDGGLGSSG